MTKNKTVSIHHISPSLDGISSLIEVYQYFDDEDLRGYEIYIEDADDPSDGNGTGLISREDLLAIRDLINKVLEETT